MENRMKNIDVTSGAMDTYLSFRLGNEAFAVSVHYVLNILEMKPITKVPQAPSYMRGVINLRGQVLPVIDMRVRFGMGSTEVTTDTCIIVLNLTIDDEDVILGILVDAVSEVLELDNEKIEPSPSIGTKYKAEFIKGMWKKEDGFIMLLNINLIFTRDEIIAVDEKKLEADIAEVEEKEEVEDK